LKNLGYDPGQVDGDLGPRTKEAIKEFQGDNPPLAVDGICGPKTNAALVDAYGM
jgi:peptidoglycan hydrolase-like protein with peptidoglycan-binding domain